MLLPAVNPGNSPEYATARVHHVDAQSKTGKFPELVEASRGRYGGTLAHPKLAVFFARWLDVRFSVWCNAVIEDILKGTAKAVIATPQEPAALGHVHTGFPGVWGRPKCPSTVNSRRKTSSTMANLSSSWSVMRLLVNHKGVLRRLAFIELGQDGSTNLGLPRDGANTTSYELSNLPGAAVQTIEYSSPRERTMRISIHISGRINFKWDAATSPVFIPCLLDLKAPAHVVTYIVPDISRLDTVGGRRADDALIEMPFAPQGHVAFDFEVLPWDHPTGDGEVIRAVVEEAYALRCSARPGDLGTVAAGLPSAGFTTLTTTADRLDALAIPEDAAYLRFQHHRHARAVREAATRKREHMDINDEMIATEIARGPGILAPNGEGIWTVICPVPMRCKPELHVTFKEPWYRAELVDLRPDDRRLERVRVRFKIQDTRTGAWVRGLVGIDAAFLDSRL